VENMTTKLRKLLENAKGSTEHIIAIVLDIRGFTPFCQINESLDVANFLKRIYIRIIDEYFPKASFYKPTGDGLLIVIRYSQESRKDTIADTMQSCLNLLQSFGKLREGDEMIYFPTPDKIGIGVSRGTACCISSGATIVDYSGKVINLASRLNDFARPSGIVFDFSLGMTLLPKEIQELFLSDNVYVRGIAEDNPITVYYTKEYTIISPSRKKPLKEPRWIETSFKTTYEMLKKTCLDGIEYYNLSLKEKPLDEKRIYIEAGFYDNVHRHYWHDYEVGTAKGVAYFERGAKRYVKIDLGQLIKDLADLGAKENTEVDFYVTYPSFEDTL
jgi:hypothetical protein